MIVIPHPGESNHNGGTAPVRPRRPPLLRARATAAAAGDPHGERPEQARAARQADPDQPAQARQEALHDPAVATRSSAARAATRSTRSACATRSASRSTARPADPDRRRRAGQLGGGRLREPARACAAPTSAGTTSRASTASTTRATTRRRGPSTSYRPPIHEYSHGGGRCAIIGGYLVRDRTLRSLSGRYVYEDLCTGQLRSLVPHRKHAAGDRALGLRCRTRRVSAKRTAGLRDLAGRPCLPARAQPLAVRRCEP